MEMDSLKEKFMSFWVSVQELPAYSAAQEKWHGLSGAQQKISLFGFSFIFILCLIWIFPYSAIDSSFEAEDKFEVERTLTRELLKANQKKGGNPTAINAPPSSALEVRINSSLRKADLLPEQISGITKYAPSPSVMSPKGIESEGYEVSVKTLNITQVLNVGYNLQVISPGVKVAGLAITTSKVDSHYFDVIYKLIGFTLPKIEIKVPKSSGKKGKGRRKRPSKKKK